MTLRKVFKAAPEELGARQVRVRCSSDAVDRSGDIVVQEGIRFAPTVPVLWQHDPDRPIGRAAPFMQGGSLYADIEFAPEGISSTADEICGLMKCGVVDTVSIGFDPIDAEPMDARKPRGPQKYLASELLELSCVSVPANPDANVVMRDKDRATPAQEKSMPNADETARAARVAKMRAALSAKGMWTVGYLAELLDSLGYVRDSVTWEAEFEGDGSKVPAMMAGALQELGEAFLAMAAEEVAELVGTSEEDDVVEALDVLPAGDAEVVMSGGNAAIRKFRAARSKLRARSLAKSGRKLSAATIKLLKGVNDAHSAAIETQKDLIAAHKSAIKTVDDLINGDTELDDDTDTDATDGSATGDAPEEEGDDQNTSAKAARLKTYQDLAGGDAA